jgi:ABC-type thiamine transport system ATPase subunit
MPAPHLVLDRVCVELGGTRILQDVSLIISEREFVCVIGTSGGGKTTLLRTIAGLLPAASGTVTLAGAPVIRPSPHAAMVFQHFGLFPWKNVRANVAYGARVQGRPADPGRLLAALGLADVADRYPAQLSGGMKQRVGIARALLTEPELAEVARGFCSSERRMWADLVLPSALPFIVTGLRLAVGRALIGVIVAEYYTSASLAGGLGDLIQTNASNFDTARMFVPVVVIAALGVVLTALLELAERRLALWRSEAAG